MVESVVMFLVLVVSALCRISYLIWHDVDHLKTMLKLQKELNKQLTIAVRGESK